MAGLSFGNTKVGQRVIGNKIDDRRYAMPEGWGAGNDVKTIIDPTEEKLTPMLLLQPSKSLNLKPASCSNHSYIREFKRTEELLHVLQKQSAEDLEELMDLGKKMAKSHVERFQTFAKMPGKQAILMLGGDALEAAEFGSTEEKWCERHVRMICGLYGLLRPYDDVKPVRDVPMQAKLKTEKSHSVAGYWTESLTKMLGKDITECVKGGSGKVLLIVNMSDEYWKAVMPSGLPKNIRLIQITFEGANDDNTSKARSLFARHVIRKKVDTVEGLTEFSHDDWVFDKTRSRDAQLIFNWDGESSGAAKKKKEEMKAKDKRAKPTENVSYAPGYHSDSDASQDSGGGKKKAARNASPASSAGAGSDAPRKKKSSKKAAAASAASDDSARERKEKKKKGKEKERARDSRSPSRKRRRRRSRS